VLGGMVASSLAAVPDVGIRERLAPFAAAHAPPEAGVVERPPLLGDGHAGDAHVCYVAAVALLGRGDLGPWLWWRSRADADAVAAAVEPVVAMVRIGASARSVEFAPTRAWGLPIVHRLQPVLRSVRRRAVDRAEWTDAVELWAAETTLVLDLAPDFPQQLSFDRAWPLEHLSRMPAPAAVMLRDALARLDERLPVARDATAALAAAVQRVLSGADRPFTRLRDRVAAWRVGFDPQRRELEVAAALVVAVPVLAQPENAWPERARRWQRLFDAAPECDLTRVGYAMRRCRDAELAMHTVRTELRLLQLALAFTFGEPLPELADPFGTGAFDVRIDGDVARFRSAAAPRVLQRDAVRRAGR
jgi:hypothetical protein